MVKPDEKCKQIAEAAARTPADVPSLARSLARDPAQVATFYLRDGIEYVRVETAHDRSLVIDRPATNVDRARWDDEYVAFVRPQIEAEFTPAQYAAVVVKALRNTRKDRRCDASRSPSTKH